MLHPLAALQAVHMDTVEKGRWQIQHSQSLEALVPLPKSR